MYWYLLTYAKISSSPFCHQLLPSYYFPEFSKLNPLSIGPGFLGLFLAIEAPLTLVWLEVLPLIVTSVRVVFPLV